MSSLQFPVTPPKGAVAGALGPDTSPGPAYLALLGVGQDLVLLLGVENQRFHREGDELLLESGPLVRAEEQTLVPVAERGAHQDDLKHKGWRREPPLCTGQQRGRQELRGCPLPPPIRANQSLIPSLHSHFPMLGTVHRAGPDHEPGFSAVNDAICGGSTRQVSASTIVWLTGGPWRQSRAGGGQGGGSSLT